MPTVRLRQDTVRTLPYSGTRNSQWIYWDETLPSFGLRVYPNGRRSYVYAYRVNGRKRLATLGRSDVLTLDVARRKARAALGDVADGHDPQLTDDALKASGTVRTLCEEYIERHAKPKKRTWKDDEAALKRHLIPKLGSRLAATITSDEIGKLHSDVGATAPYAANRLLEVVRKMFNLARTWRRVPRETLNPATDVEKFHEFKRRRYVTAEEVPILARAIDAEPNDYARHAFWLLLFTGLRCSELLRAKWTDVDWDQRTLYVSQTKNGDPVLVPLSRAAIARLKQIPKMKDNPYIICGSEPGQHLINLYKPWTRIRKEAGLSDLRIHDLRRTVGSWLVRDGASLHLVGAVLNHKDQKTTAGYAYFQTEDRTRALDRHGKRLLASSRMKRPGRRHKEQIAEMNTGSNRGAVKVHRLTRQQLYELVWSKPISRLAEQFDISDVGLAKACRRANVPIPHRGYWAKVQAGVSATKEPMPACDPSVMDEIAIRGSRGL
jgi:integrase